MPYDRAPKPTSGVGHSNGRVVYFSDIEDGLVQLLGASGVSGSLQGRVLRVTREHFGALLDGSSRGNAAAFALGYASNLRGVRAAVKEEELRIMRKRSSAMGKNYEFGQSMSASLPKHAESDWVVPLAEIRRLTDAWAARANLPGELREKARRTMSDGARLVEGKYSGPDRVLAYCVGCFCGAYNLEELQVCPISESPYSGRPDTRQFFAEGKETGWLMRAWSGGNPPH